MTCTLMIIIYDMALANFCNHVNSKFSAIPTPHRTHRKMQETRGFGKGRETRGGRGGRSPRGRGRGRVNLVRKRQYMSLITLTNGTVIEYHPSFKFVDVQFRKFKAEDKQRLFGDRDQYKRAKAERLISALQPYYPMPQYHVPQYAPYLAIGNFDHQNSHASQVTSAGIPP